MYPKSNTDQYIQDRKEAERIYEIILKIIVTGKQEL